jgi:hypothetical protein
VTVEVHCSADGDVLEYHLQAEAASEVGELLRASDVLNSDDGPVADLFVRRAARYGVRAIGFVMVKLTFVVSIAFLARLLVRYWLRWWISLRIAR